MKRLNRKGYLTVEIIIASVIAFAIAFFLMEITINLVDITDNEYVDTNFMTDKALIMKNIKKNVKSYLQNIKDSNDSLMTFDCQNNKCFLESEDGSIIQLSIENNEVIFKEEETTIYSKKLDSNYGNITLNGGREGNYVYFQIKGNNIFSDELYDINIIVYNG